MSMRKGRCLGSPAVAANVCETKRRETRLRLEMLENRAMLSSGAGALATYVGALYGDLLGRAADASGQTYWAGRLEQGVNFREAAASIVRSREYIVDRIDAAYAAVLARGPDRDGLNYWLEQSEDRLDSGLLAADEFYARVGGNDRAFIQAAYQIVLERPAEQAAQQYWSAELAAGGSRSDFILSLIHSRESEQRRISDDYQRVFQRTGDESGIAFWQKQIAGGTTNDEVLTDFVCAAEYFKQRTGEPITATPVKSTLSWWSTFDDQINARAQKGNIDLMFVGDSITAGWDYAGFGINVWSKQLAGPNVMLSGIPGDETQTLLWRLEHGDLDHVRPKLTVLMIGTNNIRANDSPADVASGVRAVVDTLRRHLPETKILVMGIPPIGETLDEPFRRAVAATNALLVGVADGKTVYYLDIGPALVDANGRFLPGVIQRDFTHLTESGYQIWASAIEPIVKAVVA